MLLPIVLHMVVHLYLKMRQLNLMEAVLCSKKRTDDYLWVINKVYVQTLCHDLAKRLSYYLYFFSFLFLFLWTYNYKVERGKVSRDFVTMSQWCDGGSQMVTLQVTVTRCHMTRVT